MKRMQKRKPRTGAATVRRSKRGAPVDVSRLRIIVPVARGIVVAIAAAVLLLAMHAFLVIVRLDAISWILPIGTLAALGLERFRSRQ